MDSKQILEVAVKAANDKRAEDILALDMEKVSLITDYFLIMDATSNRQVQAITDAVHDAADAADIDVKRIEGREAGRWVLIDLGDVMVHVFQKEERGHYNLEKLWSDAPTVDLSDWVEA
ncbi:ribosome silencing factor RsfS [Secundilactobacillus paracollinoides]|uniref:Ribosomal silencing factor RsfS n=1 Tax=Secundilactobacillus paracollinoides TaxID=240427 RepID=A0A1B2J1L8_9LACO|nr:ribosome silencing factor [Secundilactobacillus paracollinoides]ANZ62191.1 ribosome silencing factor RsfS [Secundilactobacillus paracollinoides]ANZ63880.1 ribosome silencing factor RsfS [Secundilactobacillus paracollinoides]ANZ68138.1 ribosome silencing factor RsfS [Secundilactobacillus paracollinoides]KRL76379.1 Iojap family protein [Secundilactobacillus paracollinoides DSM 15502 = JCM 11969]